MPCRSADNKTTLLHYLAAFVASRDELAPLLKFAEEMRSLETAAQATETVQELMGYLLSTCRAVCSVIRRRIGGAHAGTSKRGWMR